MDHKLLTSKNVGTCFEFDCVHEEYQLVGSNGATFQWLYLAGARPLRAWHTFCKFARNPGMKIIV